MLSKPAVAHAFGLIDAEQLVDAERLARECATLATSGHLAEAQMRYGSLMRLVAQSGIDTYDVQYWEGQASWVVEDVDVRRWLRSDAAKKLLRIPSAVEFGVSHHLVHAALDHDYMVSYNVVVEILR